MAWLDEVLEIRKTANYDLEDIDYEIKICDSPLEVESYVYCTNKELADYLKSRLLKRGEN